MTTDNFDTRKIKWWNGHLVACPRSGCQFASKRLSECICERLLDEERADEYAGAVGSDPQILGR